MSEVFTIQRLLVTEAIILLAVLILMIAHLWLQAKRMVECFFDRLIPNRKARIESSIVWVVLLMLSAATFRAVNEDLYSEKFPWPVVPFEIPKSKDTVSLLLVSRPRRKKKRLGQEQIVCYFLKLRLEFSVVWTLRRPWFFLSVTSDF